MPEITLDYYIPATVVVDTDTSEVLGARVHSEDFNCVKPVQVNYFGDDDSIPSELPETHELWEKAVAIGSRVRSTMGEFELKYDEAPRRFLVRLGFGDDRELRTYAVWAHSKGEAAAIAHEQALGLVEVTPVGTIADDVPDSFYDAVLGSPS